MNVPLYTLGVGVARGLMADLWGNTLQAYVSNDPAYGIRIQDDFVEPVVANTTDATAVSGWFIQDANAGGTSESLVSTAGPDGVRTLSATTGTAHFGIEAHKGTTATSHGCVTLPTHGTAASRRGRVVYQTRLNITAGAFFVGLTEPIVEFLGATSGLPASSDYIGFYYDGTTLKFVMANDNNGGVAVTDEISLPSGTLLSGFNKFGFAVNPTGSVDVVVNEKWYGGLAKTLNPLALPIETLTLKYAITAGAGTANVSAAIDGHDVFVAAA